MPGEPNRNGSSGGGSARPTNGGGGGGGGGGTDLQQQQNPEKKETRSEVFKRITSDSKPVEKLKPQYVDAIKRAVTKKIFPYSKFLMKEEEVNTGYVQLAFVEMGWGGTKPTTILACARAWRLVVLEVMKRCGDRHSRALTVFKKICNGT